MRKITYIASAFLSILFLSSCDFLDKEPEGIMDKDKAMQQTEGLVIAAYSALGNDHYDTPFSLWPYGNVRSDDAYKGGGGTNDIQAFHHYETSQNIDATFGEADKLWFNCYQGISRTNAALKALNSHSSEELLNKDGRKGEMYFLRGHFYFMLKIVFGHIPFVDENTEDMAYDTTTNTLPNDEQWAFIVSDFQKAYELLPEARKEVGRADKIAAAAYLAKANLYKAYRQDEKNNVTGIDADDLKEVVKYTDLVMNSSYGLEVDYAFNFLPGGFENGIESIFAVQFSHDDGTEYGRLNWSDVLATPQKLGCCDFHKPSQNLVNAFKTKDGIPMFDDFDAVNYNSATDDSDPRLFHTVAMPGFPFKYSMLEENLYAVDWNRNTSVYGVYASLKENVDPSCDCFQNINPFRGNSKNRIVLRFSEVMLMQAEALIELHRSAEALPLINKIRERAGRSTSMIGYAPNLRVNSYKESMWNEDFARKALRWERRLELAMEGSRFFDLVRWGVVDQVINAYYTSEAPRRGAIYNGARFTKNKNEYIPIPQNQIGFVKGIYKQNYGW